MSKLTKRDIVVSISNQTGMVQHQVFNVVQRTLDHITDSLARNVAVELRNFGVFQPRLTKPRVGRNPNQPGSSFVIPPRATVKFKAGKIMRTWKENASFIEALKAGRLGHLGLDVYEEEAALFFEDRSWRILQDDVFARLLTFPNVIVTGHQGFFTAEALTAIADTTLQAVTEFEQGRIPTTAIRA